MDSPLIVTPRVACRPGPDAIDVLAAHPFVAIDLETTGGSPAMHRIVEVGAVKMRADGTVVDRFSQITNPGNDVPLPPAAQRIHGLTPAQIRSAPPLPQVLCEFVEFVGSLGVIAHNLSFENRFLTAAFDRVRGPNPQWQGVCTLATARSYIPADSHKLGRLLELLGLDAVNDHRAATDAHACGLLAAHMITTMGLSALQRLPSSTHRPPQTAGAADGHAGAVSLVTETLQARILSDKVTAPTTNDHLAASTPPNTPPAGASAVRPGPRRTLAPVATSVDAASLREAFDGHSPTEEQRIALDAFAAGNDLKLTAVAGSGKTSTLLGISRVTEQTQPGRNGLYIAFNNSVAREAQRRFPRSVAAMTAHALARKNIQNTSYGPLLAKLNGDAPRWATTAEAIYPKRVVVSLADGRKLFSSYHVGRYALQAVERFCQTLDADITIDHMPTILGVERGSESERELADAVIPCARRAWRNALDPNSFAVRFTHGHYLKLFADSHPRIGRDGDYLLVDEAQDLNPVLKGLVVMQHHLQLVLVGDSNQRIYGFTGACDALETVTTDTAATLTQSFRFGDAIADAANVYLSQLESPVRVRGNPAIDDRVDFALTDTDAVLARTNGGAISEVLVAQKAGQRVGLVGDSDAVLKFCDTARSLLAGQTPKDTKYAAFSTWGELTEYLENQPGVSDVATQAKLIEDHGVDVIEAAIADLVPARQATTIVATAHKAKGLEYESVRIADDFLNPGDPDVPRLIPLSPEDVAAERRLAYVAMTRARTALNPGALLRPKDLSVVRSAPAGMLL